MKVVSYQIAYEYQFNARRTFAELDSRKLEVAHMVMGMCGEISELYEAVEKNDVVGIGEELTDIQWFLANLLYPKPIYALMFELIGEDEFETKHEDALHGLMISVSKLTDEIKRQLIYGKSSPENYFEYVALVIKYSVLLYNKYDLDIEKCMENNINKLKIRYPEKFNLVSAVNRNLEQERVELEKN